MRNIGVFTEECVYFKDKIQGSSHKMLRYISYHLLSVLKTSLWQCSSSSSSVNVGGSWGGGGGQQESKVWWVLTYVMGSVGVFTFHAAPALLF